MRILHILNHIQTLGNGIVNVAIDLAIEQSIHGHTVAIASKGYDTSGPLLEKFGVTHFTLDQTRKPLNLLRASVRYKSIIHAFKPEIVHAHMMTGMVLAKTLRLGSVYKLISTVHNELQKSSIAMGLADRVIAVSTAAKYSMARRGIPLTKLSVVTNGSIGSRRHKPPLAYDLAPLQGIAIVTVAGMYRHKGIMTLLDAFEQLQHPDAHLYIVGDGPDRVAFQDYAQQLSSAPRIHFEGFQLEPQRYLRAARIFVLPSIKDACPLVLIEAREHGCAIIASDVDGIPEALDHGKAGLLFPVQDSAALARQINALLADDLLYQDMKMRSQQDLARFSVTRLHEETLAIYQL